MILSVTPKRVRALLKKQDAIPAEILHLAQHELPSNKLIYGMDALLEEMSPPYVETNDEIPSGNQQENENDAASAEPEDDMAKQLRGEAVEKRKMQLAVSMFSVRTEEHRPRMPESDLLWRWPHKLLGGARDKW